MCASSVEAFNELMGETSFSSFEEFRVRFDAYQKATASCYTVRTSSSVTHWNEKYGTCIPECIRYYYARFVCVHAVSKKAKSLLTRKRKRDADYGCPSRICLRYMDGMLHIVKLHLEHNHSFQEGKPWLYTRNRRLSPEQLSELYEIMHTFPSGRELQMYIAKKYDVFVNKQDIYQLRQSMLHQNQYHGDSESVCEAEIQCLSKLAGSDMSAVRSTDCSIGSGVLVPPIINQPERNKPLQPSNASALAERLVTTLDRLEPEAFQKQYALVENLFPTIAQNPAADIRFAVVSKSSSSSNYRTQVLSTEDCPAVPCSSNATPMPTHGQLRPVLFRLIRKQGRKSPLRERFTHITEQELQPSELDEQDNEMLDQFTDSVDSSAVAVHSTIL